MCSCYGEHMCYFESYGDISSPAMVDQTVMDVDSIDFHIVH